MSLMHPRVAHNFAKNGYYPTDSESVERIINMLSVAQGNETLRVFDPCAGEGQAIQTIANYLGAESYAVEYDSERINCLRHCVDKALQSDFFDTVISNQSFGLIWLNPPYGYVASEREVTDKEKTERLEKMFFKRCLGLQQLGAILVFIVPIQLVDDEMLMWLDSHYERVTFYDAVDTTYQQVIIIAKKIKVRNFGHENKKQNLLWLKQQLQQRNTIPYMATQQYEVPLATKSINHFYSINIEPEVLQEEIQRLGGGLWQNFTTFLGVKSQIVRPPLTKMSDWHLALALAAGAISGVITSPTTGRVLLIKGDTYKTKLKKIDVTVNHEDEVTEIIIMLDKFIPVIKAWDLTPNSASKGSLLTISETVIKDETIILFDLGQIVMTPGVQQLDQSKVMQKLQLHQTGDWGDLCEEDQRINQQAINNRIEGILQERLFSTYKIDSVKIYSITEWHEDLSSHVTTILLASEY